MRKYIGLLIGVFLFTSLFGQSKLKVVTTLTTYADIVKYIGGSYVDVTYIVEGNQDAHFVRPKPSFARIMHDADVFVTTGLDLELWVPSLIDMSKNPKIRSGQPGYVAAYDGIHLLEKPTNLSRSEGGLHIYGNPHITSSPINLETIAKNITIGLVKNDPVHAEFYKANLQKFNKEMNRRLFGETLVQLLGAKTLIKLAETGKLIPFLQQKSYKGKKLIEYLGGWMQKGAILYGQKIVTYHKNWVYFSKLFGLETVGHVEPKPGIPPSPKHVQELIKDMKKYNVKVILAANYFDQQKVKRISEKVGAIPVIVPLYVGGAPEAKDVFSLIDLWVNSLREAYQKAELTVR